MESSDLFIIILKFHTYTTFPNNLFGYKKNSIHFVFFIIHAATIGPRKLIATPKITCTVAFVIPTFISIIRNEAVNNVCIRKIGIVYFEIDFIALPVFSSQLATRKITAIHAMTPRINEMAGISIFITYITILKAKNTVPNISPSSLFLFSRISNIQILIPSTNHISFDRTVDTAYTLYPPLGLILKFLLPMLYKLQ